MINKDVLAITELCCSGAANPELVVNKIWELAVGKRQTNVCEFLFAKYPGWIQSSNEIISTATFSETFMRGIFNFPDFNCWILETFPQLGRLDTDLVFTLITQQYGYVAKSNETLAELFILFPFDGNIKIAGDYIYHYSRRMMDKAATKNKTELEYNWRQVLFKISMLEPNRYSVILDAVQPNNLLLAQFKLIEELNYQVVSIIEECPICQLCNATLITSCGHQFCNRCINQWFQQQLNQQEYNQLNKQEKTCPYCRTSNPVLLQIRLG
jgi:hypothetical protein